MKTNEPRQSWVPQRESQSSFWLLTSLRAGSLVWPLFGWGDKCNWELARRMGRGKVTFPRLILLTVFAEYRYPNKWACSQANFWLENIIFSSANNHSELLLRLNRLTIYTTSAEILGCYLAFKNDSIQLAERTPRQLHWFCRHFHTSFLLFIINFVRTLSK